MKSKFRFLILISTLFIMLYSCTSDKARKNFIFPDKLDEIDSCQILAYSDFINSKNIKIVIIINTHCNSCYSKIWLWENLENKYKIFSDVSTAFILIGKKKFHLECLKNF